MYIQAESRHVIQPSVGVCFPRTTAIYQELGGTIYYYPSSTGTYQGPGREAKLTSIFYVSRTLPREGVENTLLGPGELAVSKRSAFGFQEGQQKHQGAVDCITGCWDHVGGGWMDCLSLGFDRHSRSRVEKTAVCPLVLSFSRSFLFLLTTP